MKSKISKILGVVVTLSIIASLMVTATALPTSAATPTALNYSTISAPSNIGNVLGGTNTAGTAYSTPGINYLASNSDGSVLFAWDQTAATLYESTNFGVSWTVPGGTVAGTVVALLISPKFATDSTVVLVTTLNAFISTNAGATFTAAPTPSLEGGAITSADIGIYYATGAVTVLIGMTTISAGGAGTVSNVQMFGIAAGSYAWTTFGGMDAGVGDAGDRNVYAVKFSPNHTSDSEILCLADGLTGTAVGIPTLYSSFAGGVFGNGLALASAAPVTSDPTSAVIAMGTDYNGLSSSNTLAIGLAGAVPASYNGLYQVTGRTSTSVGTAALTTVSSLSVKSIAINAPIAIATILVGFVSNSTVDMVTAFTGTYAVTPASKSPAGTNNGNVLWKGTSTTAFCGDTGADGGFFNSIDGGANFHAISLVNVGTLADMKFSGAAGTIVPSLTVADSNDMFLIMVNTMGGAYQSEQLWVTNNGGTSWSRSMLSSGTAPIASVSVSPKFATDKTFYVSQGNVGTAGVAPMITKTADGGNTFSTMIASDKTTVIQAIDGTNYYYGGNTAGTFYKYGVWASATFTPAAAGKVFSIAINPKDATNVAVGFSNGWVYMSTDGGVTFASVGSAAVGGGTESMFVAFGPDGSLYTMGSAPTASTVVNRWQPAAAAWLPEGAPITGETGSGLAVGPDGTLYATDAVASTTATKGGIWRSLYPTAVTSLGAAACQFQLLNTSNLFTGMTSGATCNGLSVVSTATDNALYTMDAATTTSVTGAGYTGALLGFDDTMIGMPTLTSPKNGAQISTSTYAAIAWNVVTGATGYQVETDDTSTAFAGTSQKLSSTTTIGALPTGMEVTTNAATIAGTGTPAVLTGGDTYYWAVRAVTTDPAATVNNINSRWSTGWSLITALPSVATTAIPIVPAMGAQNLPVNTTFSWPAVAGATSYDFVIADASANTAANWFAIIDYGDTTSVNAYVPATALKYNTQYWWEVRADSGTSTGPWTVSTFSTGPEPTSTTATATVPVVTPTVTVINTNPAVTPTVTVINSGTGSTTPVIPTYLLWLVIVVGAVLVIAVIVLIVRTRRIS